MSEKMEKMMKSKLGEQLTLATIFCMQPEPTPAARLVRQRQKQAEWDDTILEIEEKRERIAELREEIEDLEDHISIAEKEEVDLEPEPSEEDIFDVTVPRLEEGLRITRYENDAEIRTLEFEIAEREAKLK